MPYNCIPLATIQDFASKDTNRIVGQIGKVLARKSPFINVLDGGTISNASDVVRSVVEEMAVPAHAGDTNASGTAMGALAAPLFVDDVSTCGSGASPDIVGTTEYQFKLQTLRGAGPRVCVKQARTAFKGSYLQAQTSLEKTILQIINADVRYTLLKQSGVKYTVNSTRTFGTNLNGDMQMINTQFVQASGTPVLPDSHLNFKTLYRLGTFLREEMLAEPFTTKDGEFFRVIAGADAIENLRNDADVKEDLLYLSAGSFKLGEESISGYQFQGYRGFAFGIDQQPLRSNGFDSAGNLTLINPITSTAVTNGFAQRRNSAWVNATYEVAFIIAGESFKRLVPETYTGEGTFKFAPQLAMGELEWTYFRDNDCNLYGDYGQHIYQIQRAMQPIRPHNVIPVLFKRCPFDGMPLPCSTASTGL